MRCCADAQGVPQKIIPKVGAEFDAEEVDLDPMDGQRDYNQAAKTGQPWWPQDQLVSDMALKLALMVEQLGLSASANDWTQVCFSTQAQSLHSSTTDFLAGPKRQP